MGIIGGRLGNYDTDDEKDLNEALNQEEGSSGKVPMFADYGASFVMTVKDVFSITGRGVVVTGTVSRGSLKVNDRVSVNGIGCTVSGIEAFRRILEEANEGDSVGIMLSGITSTDVRSGDVVTKP